MRALNDLLRRQDNLGYQLGALLCLNLFAGVALAGHFLTSGTLFHDNLHTYSLFRNALHSLNYFGEIQWWDPSAQWGFPSYYLSFLGHNGGTVLFAATGFIVWILGRVGVHIASYHGLYVVYFGFLVPFLFSLAFFLLVRQILTDNRAIVFCIILAAFSPGVVFNLSDVQFESVVYGLFFAAAYLNLARNPGTRAFWLLCLSAMVMAVSFNHFFLFWNVIFIPLFLLSTNLFAAETFPTSIGRVFRSVAPSQWLAGLALILVCAAPSLIVFSQGSDILRIGLETRTYEYRDLRPGNPLEAIAISTPGIGFFWTDGIGLVEKDGMTRLPPHQARWVPFTWNFISLLSYGYMGALALPLVFTGLAFGARPWRQRLLVMIAVTSCIVLFSGYSPVFSIALGFPSPLWSVNHFSDCTFRMGIFFLLILAAGLGVEVLLNGKKHIRRRFPFIFGIASAFSAGFFVIVYLFSPRGDTRLAPELMSMSNSVSIFGFMMMIIFLSMIVILWLSRTSGSTLRRRQIWLLSLLVLVDVSTVSYWKVRNHMWGGPAFRDPPIETGGMPNDDRSYSINHILIMRRLLEVQKRGFDPSRMPLFAFSGAARAGSGCEEFPEADRGVFPFIRLPERFGSDPDYVGLFHASPPSDPADFQLGSLSQTYNRIILNISSEREALFFWRDVFSPFWRAEVNGKPVKIAPAFGAFKAVAIPRGRSLVVFLFRPRWLPLALAVSFLALLFFAAFACILFLRKPHFQLDKVVPETVTSDQGGARDP